MALQSILLTLTNAARARAGAPSLSGSALLGQVAQGHAEAMAHGGYFDHIDTQGRGVGERLLAAGYNYRWCGENISAGKDTAEAVVQWWLESDPTSREYFKTRIQRSRIWLLFYRTG